MPLYKENVRRVQVIYEYMGRFQQVPFSRLSGKGSKTPVMEKFAKGTEPHDGKMRVYLDMKKNQFRQVFLNPWHMLISI